jgi:hypothetical protein
MSVMAAGVRDRSFRMVIGGAEPESVRAALEAAAVAFEALEGEIAHLREQHAEALRQLDRMGELERSLLRSCVAAEEDARIRCGAARRYATRVVAAAQEQATARLEAPALERDRIAREIESIGQRRRVAAESLAALIAALEVTEADPGPEIDAEQSTGNPGAASSTDPALAEPARLPPWPEIVPDETTAVPVSAGEMRPVNAARPSVVTHHGPRAEPPSVDRRRVESSAPGPDSAASAPGAQNRESGTPSFVAPVARRDHARRFRARPFRVPVVAGSAAALLLLLQGSTGVPRNPGTQSAVAAASFAPAPAGSHETPGEPPRDTAAAAIVQNAAAQPTAPAAAPLTIHVKPLRTCWVRVIVDDRTDARELQPGEDIVLEAQRSIVLRAGDAGALSVEVNGRVLPPLGLNGQVVERRFTAGTTE